jgi:hypothetical protein
VLVGGAGSTVTAGLLDVGREGDAPASGRAAAGGQVTGPDPVVHRARRYPGQLGGLPWGQLAVFEQPGVGDAVVVPQVPGCGGVEWLPGAGAASYKT